MTKKLKEIKTECKQTNKRLLAATQIQQNDKDQILPLVDLLLG